jgi:uncharacterized membrane protein
MDFKMYFYLFLFYSFIGWFIEVINNIAVEKKFVNRGFLIGPYCPIYGVGGTLIMLVLHKYMDDTIALFILSVVLCASIEYLTSFIMEKIFQTRWWDYTNNRFNINGRICLETMWVFGALSILIMQVLNPKIIKFIESWPKNVYNALFYILITIFVIDIIVSTIIISSVKKTANDITNEKRKDSTEEVTKYVKKTLLNKSLLSKRIVLAFPNFQTMIKSITKHASKFKNKFMKKDKKKK